MPLPLPGESAPAFRAKMQGDHAISTDDLAGRFTVLCFFGSAGVPQMAEMIVEITSNTAVYNGDDCQFVGISVDPDDAEHGRLPAVSRGIKFIFDFDCAVSTLFGAMEPTPTDALPDEGPISFQPLAVLLDASLRVISTHRIDDPTSHPTALTRFIGSLPAPGLPRPAQPQAPVLLIPMVFELELCRRLIAHFNETGGQSTGVFDEDEAGLTILTEDPRRKCRSDAIVVDDTLRNMAHARIQRRLLPEIKKAFQFDVTRMERSVIARYRTGDLMTPHRDNSTRGTAHRRFAITIPLNADDYTGGLIRFPEFGPLVYPVPTGCALVHSCSILHETTPVTKGDRYAFIPIVYDDEAAALRDTNSQFLAASTPKDRREIIPSAE
jgi:peroxiredoxin/predicted 2-oxoglutarate/Fe(II)-dependent dioxygenase YbiX